VELSLGNAPWQEPRATPNVTANWRKLQRLEAAFYIAALRRSVGWEPSGAFFKITQEHREVGAPYVLQLLYDAKNDAHDRYVDILSDADHGTLKTWNQVHMRAPFRLSRQGPEAFDIIKLADAPPHATALQLSKYPTDPHSPWDGWFYVAASAAASGLFSQTVAPWHIYPDLESATAGAADRGLRVITRLPCIAGRFDLTQATEIKLGPALKIAS
jgi:hypothetical protein